MPTAAQPLSFAGAYQSSSKTILRTTAGSRHGMVLLYYYYDDDDDDEANQKLLLKFILKNIKKKYFHFIFITYSIKINNVLFIHHQIKKKNK